MTKMTRILLALAVAPMALSLAACETLSETPPENANRLAWTVDTNGKQIPEDVERLLLLDRPSLMSPMPVPDR